MVVEVTTVGELAQAAPPKGEEFQTDLYEYTNEHMRIRARGKAGGLDHPPNVYVSVKLYGMYDELEGVETLTAEEFTEGAISSPLAYLEKVLTERTEADSITYQFKQYEDGGAVTFDASLERAEN